MRLGAGLRQNLGLKLLSVALALLLWSFVHGSKIVDRALWLPLRCVNLPDSLVLIGDPPREARVQVAGPTQELALRLRFIPGSELRIDLSRARPPFHRVTPSVSEVVLPSNSRITAVRVLEPATFDLRLDRRLERLLPVRAAFTGRLAAEYCLQDTPRVIPAMVQCYGAASFVERLSEVATRPVDLDRKHGSFTQRVELVYDPKRVRCDPGEVRLEVEVARLRSRSLRDAPLTVLAPASGDLSVDVRPGRVSVTLSGPQAEVEALDPKSVALIVDASALRPGSYSRVPLAARLPRWARLDSLRPATVDVVIHRRGRR